LGKPSRRPTNAATPTVPRPVMHRALVVCVAAFFVCVAPASRSRRKLLDELAAPLVLYLWRGD
jgi:hypothetical protein